jgi:uncharacterized membrane protein
LDAAANQRAALDWVGRDCRRSQRKGLRLINNHVPHGFLYNDGVYTTLDVPGADATFAFGINDAGQITGNYSNASGNYGFVYSHGIFTTIEGEPQSAAFGGTLASGINDAGQIVGYYSNASGNHGFLATLITIPSPVMSNVVFDERSQLTTLSGTAEANSTVSIFDSSVRLVLQ